MKINIITIFPESFPGSLSVGLIGKAMGKLWNLEIIDLKQYKTNKTIDSKPFAGGSGMVIKPSVMERVFNENDFQNIIFMSPRGTKLNWQHAERFSKKKEITIICGRYETMDQRVLKKYNIKEWSIGDFILCGGESAALVFCEAIIRLIPGVLGNSQSLKGESFSNYLLEHHQYCEKRVWQNLHVPEILLSGNARAINDFQLLNSIEITLNRRPELIIPYFTLVLGLALISVINKLSWKSATGFHI